MRRSPARNRNPWIPRPGLGLATLALLAAAACGTATGPDVDAETGASVDAALSGGAVEITLRNGQEQAVNGSLLKVGFHGVLSDSRCPVDAVCVWMGDAVVQVGVTAGTGPTHTLELHTSQEPHSGVAAGVQATLVELTPAPRAADPIRSDSYAVRLRLERAAR